MKNRGLEFPTEFPIKVIGKDGDNFQAVVIEIIQRHVVDLDMARVTTRPSAGGKYIALTATFVASSREQLDALYLELSAHEQVIMLL